MPSPEPPSPPPQVEITNTGANPVVVGFCTDSNASVCLAGGFMPCTNLGMLQPNSTTNVGVFQNASYLIFKYHSAWAFDWHPLTSAPAQLLAWPNTTYKVPYPAAPPHSGNVSTAKSILMLHCSIARCPLVAKNASICEWGVEKLGFLQSMLCDTSEDCGAGATCNTQSTPHACSSAAAPSSAPAPSPMPIPSPSPAPSAAICNLTGAWEQGYIEIGGLGHSVSASINISMTGTVRWVASEAAFVFTCTSEKGWCPGRLYSSNGTGTLSASSGQANLRLWNGSVISGVVNDTLACNPLVFVDPAIPEAPLVWTTKDNIGEDFNTQVALASFLGGAGGGGIASAPFVGSGVAVLGVKGTIATVAVAGNGPGTFGVTPVVLLNGTADGNATILLLSVDLAAASRANAPLGSAVEVVAVAKLGLRVDHLRGTAAGQLAVAGSFGVAVLDTLSASPFTVAWNDSLTDTKAGSCGICCMVSDKGATTCRLDIGEDGTVVAFLASQGHLRSEDDSGWLIATFNSKGERIGANVRDASSVDTVAVDSTRKRTLTGFFYDSNTGQEPMVMPGITFRSYAGATKAEPLPEVFRDFSWDAHAYRQPGPCDGDVADGRIMSVRMGRDGTLVMGGRSDGGNSPWHCGLRDVQRRVPFVVLDGFTQTYNMQAQAITNLILADAESGEARLGQNMVARLSNTGGNTLVTMAAITDESGNVYGLQDAACCIDSMANLTINGQALLGPSDAVTLVVLSPDLRTRHHWTHFTAPTRPGSQSAVDLDTRSGAVALLLNSEAEMAAVNQLPGASAPSPGKQGAFGYLVVLPAAVSA